MSKNRKKGIVDPFAFKGTEKLKVTFTSTTPDYQGTDMLITPVFKVSRRLLTDDEKLNNFLADQFLKLQQ